MTTPKAIIFTDLDGTLLDKETYSFELARPALQMIKQKGIPLVLSSSKTRTEIELYRKELENAHPFVSENGGAVFVPKGYLSFSFPYDRVLGEYFVLELGTFYPIILEILDWLERGRNFLMQDSNVFSYCTNILFYCVETKDKK